MSWPNIILENLTFHHMRLVATPISIQIFWFIVFYIILLLVKKFRGQISKLSPVE
jgi:hypothetical protein